MSKKIITHNNGIIETRETFYTEKTIQQLKQQLVEKDEEIKKLNWQLKDKDFIIKNLNHSLSVAPNANAGQRARIDELTKIVKEKDKEIEKLNKTLEMCKHIERYDIGEMFLENAKLIIEKRQFAIQELEKVKNFVDGRTYCADYINKRIQDLKGE